MNTRRAFHLLSIAAFLITGCNSSSQPSDAQSGGHSSSSAHGLTAATVNDPALNGMAAQTMTIPSGWKMQGTIMTSPCMQLPSVVYRAYESDGLTEMRLTPSVAWKWSTTYKIPQGKGCLPFTGPISASDLLNKYLETISEGVHVVGPMPVDAAYRKTAEDLAASLNQGSQQFVQRSGPGTKPMSHFTSDVAALHVQTRNGSFVIDQRLRTAVQCQINDWGPMAGGNCSAQIEILKAPQGKLDALVRVVDGNNLPGLHMTPEWKQAQIQLINQRGQETMAQLQRMFQAGMAAQKQMFDQFMATSQQNHEAFMNAQESRFQSSMNNATASMNARSTAASDMVDYCLDQQTVVGQGGLAKVSSAYSQTWSSTVGNQTQWYQTDNPNANPNGVLAGNWTPDTKVHGNGQSY
jgi:hypothetical protein